LQRDYPIITDESAQSCATEGNELAERAKNSFRDETSCQFAKQTRPIENPADLAGRRESDSERSQRAGRPVVLALRPPGQAVGEGGHHQGPYGDRRPEEGRSADQPISAFASIKLERQREEDLDRFAEAVARWPEVVDCYLMTGQRDYLMRILAADPRELQISKSFESQC
jgi:DNA-binding Lrp family transcriptional regulator